MKKLFVCCLIFFLKNASSQDIYFPESHVFNTELSSDNFILKVTNDTALVYSGAIGLLRKSYLRTLNLKTNEIIKELKVNDDNLEQSSNLVTHEFIAGDNTAELYTLSKNKKHETFELSIELQLEWVPPNNKTH